jgi:hypothetical protein
MRKLFLAIILSLSFSSSLASSPSMKLRCFDLFAEQKATAQKTSAPYYAEALDYLNSKYNNILFKQNVLELAQPDLKNLAFSENISARYKARKLRKTLIELHALDQSLNAKAKAKLYDLEKIAVQIEKLSFLMDDSQIKNMSVADRIAFRQVQHSVLTKGLSEFLFTRGTEVSTSTRAKIKDILLAPFKKVYLRWLVSPIMMPHLDGTVIPYEVIEKVVWEGYENSKEDIAPYLKTAQGKFAFNVFSTGYNYLLTGLVIVSAVTWIHTTTVETYEAYNRGVANAEAMLKPALENAKSLATKDLSAEFRNDALQISIEKFKERFQRDPVDQEIEMIKQLILSRQAANGVSN